ncbi:MAG: hypothetical protein D3911_01810 [Candidatus Electrothrix sp. AW3_4]|nr:hypothetical protein [Candidatus Electrothrix gigas]
MPVKNKMKKILVTIVFGVLLSILTVSISASTVTGFNGEVVRLTVDSPNLGEIIAGPHDAIVDSNIEFSLERVNNVVEVDINLSDKTIYFDYSRSSYGNFASGSFNGYVFTDINNTIPNITSVKIDTIATTLGVDDSRISYDNNQIFVNVASLSFNQDSRIKLNIGFESTSPKRLLWFPIKNQNEKVLIICM